MATGDYCTLNDLKARLAIDDDKEDGIFAQVITATSRAIDNWTGTRFWTEQSTRHFSAVCSNHVAIGNFVGVTSVSVDTSGTRTYTLMDAGDYEFYPYNAIDEKKAYRELTLSPVSASAYFPVGTKTIQVVGYFGWVTDFVASPLSYNPPQEVKEAALIQVARLYKRKDAPFGIVGGGEFGTVVAIPGLDPDVRQLLQYFRRIL